MDTIIYYYLLVVYHISKFAAIENSKNPLPLLTSVRRYFCNMLFLKNYLLTTDMSSPVTVLKLFQRFGILKIKSQFPLSPIQRFSWAINSNS